MHLNHRTISKNLAESCRKGCLEGKWKLLWIECRLGLGHCVVLGIYYSIIDPKKQLVTSNDPRYHWHVYYARCQLSYFGFKNQDKRLIKRLEDLEDREGLGRVNIWLICCLPPYEASHPCQSARISRGWVDPTTDRDWSALTRRFVPCWWTEYYRSRDRRAYHRCNATLSRSWY